MFWLVAIDAPKGLSPQRHRDTEKQAEKAGNSRIDLEIFSSVLSGDAPGLYHAPVVPAKGTPYPLSFCKI